MPEGSIGIIGGSGLYGIEELGKCREIDIITPYGKPSDSIMEGVINGKSVYFLSRHGRGHGINPSNVPNRANIYAFKMLGVDRIISVSAVGSLRDNLAPCSLLIPDQLIDRTRARPNTFYDEIAVHVGFRQPFCPNLCDYIQRVGKEVGENIQMGGTYVCMEGPAFSTRAESELYRSWGASVIGMTALPEAKLAREAEICYASICVITDYDVWREECHVSVEMVMENLQKSIARVKHLLHKLVGGALPPRECECSCALRNAIITARDQIPPNQARVLGIFFEKYLGNNS